MSILFCNGFNEKKFRTEKSFEECLSSPPEAKLISYHQYGRNSRNKWILKDDSNNNLIHFDFDPVDKDGNIKDRLGDIIGALHKVIGVNQTHCHIIFTGRGYHFLVKTIYDIDDKEWFRPRKKSYRFICDQLQKLLPDIIVDPEVFGWWKFTRWPGATNDKTGATVELKNTATHTFAKDFLKEEAVSNKQTVSFSIGRPDLVIQGCPFISEAKARPDNRIEEPKWYRLLRVLSFLPNGRELAHEYSKDDDRYNPDEVDAKFNQCLSESSTPPACEFISEYSESCQGCQHRGNIPSPLILGEELFKHQGAHQGSLRNEKGKLIPSRCAEALNNIDLCYTNRGKESSITKVSYYHREDDFYKHISLINVRQILHKIIQQDAPELDPPVKLDGIIEAWVNNYPDKDKTGKVNPTHLLNMKNGVLDLRQGTLTDSDACFDYVMDYEFNEREECPFFEEKLNEWLEGVEEQKDLLLRFVGMGIMGVSNTQLEYFLLLYGKTCNGKSKFIDTVNMLMGTNNISNVSLKHLSNSQYMSMLVDKKFNLCDETSRDDRNTRFGDKVDWDVLKQVLSGNPVVSNPKHTKQFSFVPTAKVILSANKIPKHIPDDNAIKRRLLMINFPNSFEGREDKELMDKLSKEKSGILNLFLRHGKQAIKENYSLNIPDSVKYMADDVASELSSDELFFKEYLDFEGTEWVGMHDIYTAYTMFCSNQGISGMYVKANNSVGRYLTMYMRENNIDMDRKKRTGKGYEYRLSLKSVMPY